MQEVCPGTSCATCRCSPTFQCPCATRLRRLAGPRASLRGGGGAGGRGRHAGTQLGQPSSVLCCAVLALRLGGLACCQGAGSSATGHSQRTGRAGGKGGRERAGRPCSDERSRPHAIYNHRTGIDAASYVPRVLHSTAQQHDDDETGRPGRLLLLLDVYRNWIQAQMTGTQFERSGAGQRLDSP